MSELLLAIAKTRTTEGITFQLDGDDAPLEKRYKYISNGVNINANDRILVLKDSGTYIVIGKIVGG